MHDYAAFLASKALRAEARGLTLIPELAPHLFPFQQHCVEFALRAGASGCFLSTGLGKTEVQLEFCQRALEATNSCALILTPLAVAAQTRKRAEKWGYEARVIREQSDVGPCINICNYDRIDKLDLGAFGVVSLDESSILKSFDGKTSRGLIDSFSMTPFRLAATATPAPNDHMELGQHSSFVGVMEPREMLSRFFINDTSTASQQWRLKGHAVAAFWDWVASWARAAELPSDITGDAAHDAAFILPPFEVIRHRARDSAIDRDFGDMFGVSLSATNVHNLKRQTIEARAELAAEIVAAQPDEMWLIWCNINAEADALMRAIPDVIEVRGSQSTEEKEEKLGAFADGTAKRIIGKPSMMGFGLDWSHCANVIFVGRSFSFEEFYQAVRRCWRFGQKRRVRVHLIVAEGENEIGRVIDRKSSDHAEMKIAMRDAMRRASGQLGKRMVAYAPSHIGRLPVWL